jgi:hypothetical protein
MTIKYSNKKVVNGADQNKKSMNVAKFSSSKQCEKKSSAIASTKIFSPYKDDRNNYSTTAIEETKNVSQHAEISCTHVEHVVQSSCESTTENHVDTIDDASNGLSMLVQGVQSDGTAIQVKGQCSSIFQCQCKIHDKGIQHVFKPMLESGIKSEVFAPIKKKYQTATSKPKLRMALLHGEGNDVAISNTSDEPPMKEGPRIISKPRTVLLKGGEDIMMTISAPTTTIIVNSINPI